MQLDRVCDVAYPSNSVYARVVMRANIRPASGISPERVHDPCRMTQEEYFMATHKRLTPITEVHLALAPNASFEDIVAVLKQTLTVPELPGFKGCRPCLSGLDRFIVEDIAMQGIR